MDVINGTRTLSDEDRMWRGHFHGRVTTDKDSHGRKQGQDGHERGQDGQRRTQNGQ